MTKSRNKWRGCYWIGLLGLAIIFGSCRQQEISDAYAFQAPEGFPEPVYNLAEGQLNMTQVQLGRALFYDKMLSADTSTNCGSCHISTSAFSDPGHSVSHGIHGRLGTRNAPALQNLAWEKSFLWDGGVFKLDLQPIVPIENPVEMDLKMDELLKRLQENKKYREYFRKAFGDDSITTVRLLKSLSQFMLTMVSAESRYDAFAKGDKQALNGKEKAGFVVFQNKCASCHPAPLFTDQQFRNNGLLPENVDDQGRAAITLSPEDQYRFKVPSLRNVAVTAPYMHDGRFFTLDAVLDHYDHAVKPTNNLDPLLNKNGQLGIPLSDTEKAELLAFLKTLTDENFIHNRSLAAPQ